MAVTVEATPHLVLDESDRIVGVGPAAQAGFAPLLGQIIWDCFRDSKPLFQPYYEKARQTSEPVEFLQFYQGVVGHIRAVPVGQRLEITWEQLLRLDPLTLEGLSSSIADAVALLEGHEAEIHRHEVRGKLRVLEGGRA